MSSDNNSSSPHRRRRHHKRRKSHHHGQHSRSRTSLDFDRLGKTLNSLTKAFTDYTRDRSRSNPRNNRSSSRVERQSRARNRVPRSKTDRSHGWNSPRRNVSRSVSCDERKRSESLDSSLTSGVHKDDRSPPSGKERSRVETKRLSTSPLKKDLDILQMSIEDKCAAELMGDIPPTKKLSSAPINGEIAKRWEHIALSGLESADRAKLMDTYPPPSNATKLGAPKLNDQIKAVGTEYALERDQQFESLQTQLSAGLTALGNSLTKLLSTPHDNQTLALNELVDSAKLFLDMQHSLSVKRRQLATSAVKSTVIKKIADKTSVDTLLFGEDFQQRIKEAEELEKLGKQLNGSKVANSLPKKKSTNFSSTSRYVKSAVKTAKKASLNYRGPPRYQQQRTQGGHLRYQQKRR